MNSKSPVCLVCGLALSPVLSRKHRICDRQECHWRYALLQRQHKICKVCKRPLSGQGSSTQVCADPACQRSAVADRARELYERKEARRAALLKQVVEQAGQLLKQVIHAVGVGDPGSLPLVVIPACISKVVNLPERRRRKLRDFLTTLITQALASPPEAPLEGEVTRSQAGQVSTFLGQACACCKGFCCQEGADDAYLKVETVRRYMAARPDRRPRDVLADYLARVSHKTYRGSCIFHARNGCTLPRDMRSDVCNRHFCKALHELQKDLPAMKPIRAFFVAAHDGEVHAAVLVDADRPLTVHDCSGPMRAVVTQRTPIPPHPAG